MIQMMCSEVNQITPRKHTIAPWYCRYYWEIRFSPVDVIRAAFIHFFVKAQLFQYWMMSKDGEIRRDETCVDYAGQDVMVFPCHGMKGNQEWRYNHEVRLCVSTRATSHFTPISDG